MKAAIVVEEVHKSYGGLQVLKGLSLQVVKGETLVILGRSGAGKSVLLRLIMGLEPPDRGVIRIDDQGGVMREQGQMGMLFQNSALFDSLTIEENVAFPLTCSAGRKRFGSLTTHEVRSRVAHALDRVGLHGKQRSMPADLSGGMRRRAALARLLVYHPRILLYDEPTTGLDPITAMQINELMAMIQLELHATSIVVTHDLTCALTVADRLALHHQGQIAYIGKKTDFLRSDHPLVKQFLLPSVHTFEQFIPNQRS